MHPPKNNGGEVMKRLDAAARSKLLRTHPLTKDQYTVLTPMIRAAYAIFRERVFFRHSGAFMFAFPRMGKTRCAMAVKELLKSEFPDIYVLYHTADSDRSVYLIKDLLVAAGAPTKVKENRAVQLERLVAHIADRLEFSEGDQFVLILDEIQLVQVPGGYNELLVLHNRLEAQGIKMTTLGFGQPQILDVRTMLLQTDFSNLVARFLSEPVRFDGCLSSNVLQAILAEVDDKTEFPENSGCTFTNFFLPVAYQNGYRLASQHGDLWTGLNNVVSEHIVPRIPFSFIIRLINHLLIANRMHDCAEFQLTTEMIDASLKQILLAEFMQSMEQK